MAIKYYRISDPSPRRQAVKDLRKWIRRTRNEHSIIVNILADVTADKIYEYFMNNLIENDAVEKADVALLVEEQLKSFQSAEDEFTYHPRNKRGWRTGRMAHGWQVKRSIAASKSAIGVIPIGGNRNSVRRYRERFAAAAVKYNYVGSTIRARRFIKLKQEISNTAPYARLYDTGGKGAVEPRFYGHSKAENEARWHTYEPDYLADYPELGLLQVKSTDTVVYKMARKDFITEMIAHVSTDDVDADLNSGPLTIIGSAHCKDLNFLQYYNFLTIDYGSSLTIHEGDALFGFGVIPNGSGTIYMDDNHAGVTVQGLPLPYHFVVNEHAEVYMNKAFICPNAILENAGGTLDLNNKNISCSSIVESGTHAKTFILGTGTMKGSRTAPVEH